MRKLRPSGAGIMNPATGPEISAAGSVDRIHASLSDFAVRLLGLELKGRRIDAVTQTCGLGTIIEDMAEVAVAP